MNSCLSAVFKTSVYSWRHHFLLGNLCCHLEARSVTLSAQMTFIRWAFGGLRDRVSSGYTSRTLMWCNVLFSKLWKNNRGRGKTESAYEFGKSGIESALLSLGFIWLLGACVPDCCCCDFRRQKVRIVHFTDEIEWGHEDLFTGKQEDFYCSWCQG